MRGVRARVPGTEAGLHPVNQVTQGWVAVAGSIALCETGSYVLKTYADGMWLAMMCWIASSLLWLVILPRLPLGVSSVVYSVGTSLVAVPMGMLLFQEPITARMAAGCVCGVAAVILLM